MKKVSLIIILLFNVTIMFGQDCLSTTDIQKVFAIDTKVYYEISNAEAMLRKNVEILKGDVTTATTLNVVNIENIKNAILASSANKKNKSYLAGLDIDCYAVAYQRQQQQLDSILNHTDYTNDFLASSTIEGARVVADSVISLVRGTYELYKYYDNYNNNDKLHCFQYRCKEEKDKFISIVFVEYVYGGNKALEIDGEHSFLLLKTSFIPYLDMFKVWVTLFDIKANKEETVKYWRHTIKLKVQERKQEYEFREEGGSWAIFLL